MRTNPSNKSLSMLQDQSGKHDSASSSKVNEYCNKRQREKEIRSVLYIRKPAAFHAAMVAEHYCQSQLVRGVAQGKGCVVAAHPYLFSRKMGRGIIHQSDFTQHLGSWVTAEFKNLKKYLSRKKKALGALIDQLPEHYAYNQYWHFSKTYWVPFRWRGFQKSIRFTYRINELGGKNAIWGNLHENIRREIRKAEKRFNLKIDDGASIDELMHVVELTFKRQRSNLPFNSNNFRRIDAELAKIDSRKFFVARDEENRIHAGLFLLWDENCAYYLIVGGDLELRNSGAMRFCMWQALKFTSQVSTEDVWADRCQG